MHNKAFIADNSVAIVGGRNIGAEYFGASDEFNFYDVDIMAVGPIAREVSARFDDHGTASCRCPSAPSSRARPTADDLKSVRRDLETQRECLKKSTYWLKVQASEILKRIDAGQVPLVWGQAEVLSDHTLKCIDPDDSGQTAKMTQKLKGILAAGQNELLMVTPYFVPGQAGMRLLRQMRGRNLTIKIITNSFLSSDAPLAQIGYMRYRKDLLRMGVELYEIKPTLVQIQHDQERRQFAGDFRRLCSSFLQSGGSLIQRGASRIQIGGSSIQSGGSSGEPCTPRPSSWIARQCSWAPSTLTRAP